MPSYAKRIETLHSQSPLARSFREGLLPILRELLPFDAACCTSVDPITLLSTGSMTEEGVEPIHSQLFELEYRTDDLHAFHLLAVAHPSVASLHLATEGQPEQSLRYRTILKPVGFGDELRAALTEDGACWGFLTLFRSVQAPPFEQHELEKIADIAPAIARALRSYTLTVPEAASHRLTRQEPALLILDDTLAVQYASGIADEWVAYLREWERLPDSAMPRPLQAVCAKAISSGDEARTTVRIPDGTYLTLRAVRLDDRRGDAGSYGIAVQFELAKPSEILPLLAKAYALSAREMEVAELIFRGASTKEIAAKLHISAYTVQDHLKSIFDKTSVNSRRELLWQLFTRFALD
ncbi:LuxR family transcriptional regulator [Paenibacillus pinisoli]|uniref:LuxR family transcriptional regulator n=2 Tax=Paenibacillus pinisoli TaxID=1276110 RepID=A0A3A6PWF1_9BACL|nr:LuxR family transcriptional regulator [Paenibacillus pinisoli]